MQFVKRVNHKKLYFQQILPFFFRRRRHLKCVIKHYAQNEQQSEHMKPEQQDHDRGKRPVYE